MDGLDRIAPDKSEAGFTTIEAAMASVVLAVALLALWGTLVYTTRSDLAAEQKLRAVTAAQSKIDELRSKPFETLVAEFGPGGDTGNEFHVSGVSEVSEAAEGRIVFFVDEQTVFGSAGIPMDLNGDGDTLDEDVSGEYEVLPVMIVVTWTGGAGDQSVVLRSVLRGDE